MHKISYRWLTIPLPDPCCRYYAAALVEESLLSPLCTAIRAAETAGGLLIKKHGQVVSELESFPGE
ncbi:MAG TPA: hypothetical protein DDY39_00045 [Nitrospira sp.]|nr:hypothetical protein [Nitrospira sp.]